MRKSGWKQRKRRTSEQNGIVSRHSKTYSPAQCERELKALYERYPDQTELSRIGTSVLGQPIWALSFGAAAETAKTRVLVQAGMHGREWINVQIAMAQIEDYLGQEQYAALLRETALVFVPMCNPDSVRIAQEGADWIEDEAARADVQRWIDESGEPYDQWKANGRGVDLNRNFDARWDEQTEERATAGPVYAFYRGENPESEPETQALVELTNDFGPDSTITALRVIRTGAWKSSASLLSPSRTVRTNGACRCRSSISTKYTVAAGTSPRSLRGN